MRKVVLVIPLLLCLLATSAAAEDLTGRFGFGLEGGVMKLMHGQRDYSNISGFGGLRLRYGLSPNFVLNLSHKTGYVRPGVDTHYDDAGFTFDSYSQFYTTIHNPELGVLWRLAPDGSFDPYVGLGAGVIIWDVHDQRGIDLGKIELPGGPTVIGYDIDGDVQELKATNFDVSIGLGFDWFLSDHFAIDFGVRYHYMFGQNKDTIGMSQVRDDDADPPQGMWSPPVEHVDDNKALLDAYLGLTVYFGSADNDGDGIYNDEDDCPSEPEDFDGFQDEDGCPEDDNDGDGVADADDQCPNEAEDRDGFEDEDGCPDPDNDGDGILDARDRCPNEAEDMDGFEDEDGCPDVDNDGDGVLDANDKCPDTSAGVQVDGFGCALIEKLPDRVTLEGVEFATNSAELTGMSTAVLDKVAKSMVAYPDESAEIAGHTDSTGKASYNKDLSHRRAESVRQYLILKGVEASRLTAIGYGEEKPIADNGTAEGRAKNRRVEVIMHR
jgi:outer membrane protein OmpA-like peptidoglycan-associated protein/opacity protein-like surface antigen